MTEYKPGIHGCQICHQKQPQEKQTGELLATIHVHMDYKFNRRLNSANSTAIYSNPGNIGGMFFDKRCE